MSRILVARKRPRVRADQPVSLTTARERALGFVRSQPGLAETRLQLSLAGGRILAGEVIASEDQPRFDAAAMDGFALTTMDLDGDGPWQLKIGARRMAGDSAALTCLGEPRIAVEVATGAPVPKQMDAVIPGEDVCAEGGYVTVHARPEVFANMRRAGENAVAGTRLIPPKSVLDARCISLLAALGTGEVPVLRKLPVAVLSTGSELVEAGDRLRGAQIHDANRPMLLAALGEKWLGVRDLGIVPDEPDLLRLVLGEAAAGHRVVLTTGGAAHGSADFLARVIKDLGGDVLVHGIAMKPGKSTLIGVIGRTLIVGLSGNPVAAWVGLHAIVKDVLRTAAGLAGNAHPLKEGYAQFSYPVRPGWTEMPLVRRAGYDGNANELLVLSRERNSANLCRLSQSDGFAVLAADGGGLQPGSPVRWIEPD